MGAQTSVYAGKAKIDLNVDFSQKLCSALLYPSHLRISDGPFSQIVTRICVQHPNLFGGGEKLDAVWDKGLFESNVFVTLSRPQSLPHKSSFIQYSVSPELGVHGVPSENLTTTRSGGVNLCRVAAGVEVKEPVNSNWRSSLGLNFEHVVPLDDEGQPITRDHGGFPVTCSGNAHDSMIVLRQDSRYATADDQSFSRVNFQIEQGATILSKWLVFNKFKFKIARGFKLGPAFLLTSLTGGSIVGDMAPYQAFAIGGPGSVRGYGVGAIGSGRSCLVANSELTFPLMKELEGAVFLDYGSDLGSAHLVPGNPAIRQGKPGCGLGFGYGLRFNSQLGQLQVDFARNHLGRRTMYFGISSSTSRTN